MTRRCLNNQVGLGDICAKFFRKNRILRRLKSRAFKNNLAMPSKFAKIKNPGRSLFIGVLSALAEEFLERKFRRLGVAAEYQRGEHASDRC